MKYLLKVLRNLNVRDETPITGVYKKFYLLLILIVVGVIGLNQSILAGNFSNDVSVNSGSYNISSVNDYSIRDEERGKDLHLRITYPVAREKYPIIVFSHGAGGSGDKHQWLIRYWVSRGFVCLQPTHDDSARLIKEGGGRRVIKEALNHTKDPLRWVNRAKDIKLILDSLVEMERALDSQIGGKLDHDKIAVAGHSFGAFTASLIGGATPYIPQNTVEGYSGRSDFKDKRVKAIIILSPQGITKKGLGFPDKKAWENSDLPTMVMTGSEDKGQDRQPVSWRLHPFEYSPPGDKYLVYIEGASHFTFGGGAVDKTTKNTQSENQERPIRRIIRSMLRKRMLRKMGTSSNDKELQSWVKEASLDFWKAYLKEDKDALAKISSNDLASRSSGIVTITTR